MEIFHRGQRVASHVRSYQPYKATTVNEHRPKSHQQHLAWPPSRLVRWAETVGPATAQLFAEILKSKPHPEMGYRSCLGILRLGQRYSNRASGGSVAAGGRDRRLFLSQREVDSGTLARPPATGDATFLTAARARQSSRRCVFRFLVPLHGTATLTLFRKGEPMLNQPTLNKLEALRLHGMAEAFRAQADPAQRDGSLDSVSRNASPYWSIRNGLGGRTAPWRAALPRPNSVIAPRSRTLISAPPAAWTAPSSAP